MSPYNKIVHKLGRLKWKSPKAKARIAMTAAEQAEERGKSQTDRRLVRSLNPPTSTLLTILS